METNKKCEECGEEFQNEVDEECPKCGHGKVEKNVRLTLHTYREGGSMICDEQKIDFESVPTSDEIEKIVETYKRVKNYNGLVFYNISGRIKGEEELN